MILHKTPLIAQFDSQFDQSQIDRMLSLDQYTPSLGYRHQESSSRKVDARSSWTMYDIRDELRSVRSQMLDRISAELDITHDPDHSEFLQLTKYSQGQEYQPHYDHFNVAGYENTIKTDRIATALLYLNDGFVGGETYFPYLDITAYPLQGDILYFEYPPEQSHMMLHAGLPVKQGEKRIVSLWIRSGRWPVQD